MASKYQIIVGMAEHTARDITQNPDSWMSFLTTAASNYKYKFKDQILIHAQKPNATACAEIETWNRLGRWVNKGTKGIALLSDKDIPYRLRHVFDVSDTNTRVGAHISLWQMQDRYEEAVTEALENSFGEIEEKTGFASILLGTAKNAVEDNLSDYLSDLVIVKGDSYLDELDELNTEVWLKTALTNSVAFMLLTRCGMDAREYFDREDFVRVLDFNTPQTVAILGGAASDISEMVLREIGATVKNLQMEERKQNRTFADNRTSGYNDSGNKTTERSQEYGTDLLLCWIFKLKPISDILTNIFDSDDKGEKVVSAIVWIFNLFVITIPTYLGKVWDYLSSDKRKDKLCSKYFKQQLKILNSK